MSNRSELLRSITISPETSVKECLEKLNKAGVGILTVCTPDYRLEGVVTDGDIRRAFLSGIPFESSCMEIACTDPLTAPAGCGPEEVLALMDHGKSFTVDQLPLVDSQGRVVDILLRHNMCFCNESTPSMKAVVMAGGFGTRLRPLTETLPKPMLPVGDRPLLERIIDQLKEAHIENIDVTTHYMPEKIIEHFGDGSKFGVSINYVSENKPLGTAGALSLIEEPDTPLLVINGDILTQVDFNAMLAFHREHDSVLTVGVRQYEFQIPYGVIECEGAHICRLKEKPVQKFLVNAGIYLLEPEVQKMVKPDEFTNMTDLIEALIAMGKTVTSFPVMEYWLDIGQLADYNKAQSDITNLDGAEKEDE
ncbi:nucleotidyltransferase family protein [Maridesulfovibrio sp.]|uniref:nucleotidyltransferase family protein n=1 Tax=Maridesulfovibrio sp. TaxID=2795000 RepID=UPI002A18CCE9|nr:nucleotidyltransferase family protein [Maridesulfovibrio sp.]